MWNYKKIFLLILLKSKKFCEIRKKKKKFLILLIFLFFLNFKNFDQFCENIKKKNFWFCWFCDFVILLILFDCQMTLKAAITRTSPVVAPASVYQINPRYLLQDQIIQSVRTYSQGAICSNPVRRAQPPTGLGILYIYIDI